MNFLLKIVEGPNKGAEIALVAGVAVTVGKGDGCDVVLADPTLPEKPIEIEASVDGVTVDGEPLNPFVVRTSGATSFAVGPVDTPWDELKWANAESEKVESPEPEAAKLEAEKAQAPEGKQIAGRRHGGCFGCLFALLLLVLAVAAAFLFFGGRIKETDWWRRVWRFNGSAAPESVAEPEVFLGDIAAKYGLSLAESNGAVRISGDLKTRAERLRATAEIYAVRPGAELDIADDESFRASADDALFTLTEGVRRDKPFSARRRVVTFGAVFETYAGSAQRGSSETARSRRFRSDCRGGRRRGRRADRRRRAAGVAPAPFRGRRQIAAVSGLRDSDNAVSVSRFARREAHHGGRRARRRRDRRNRR